MTLTSDSMRCNTSNDKDLSKRGLKAWQTDYLNYDLKSPLLSPLFADLSGLPPLLLMAGGKDPWVSDSKSLAEKIEQSGGDVRIRLWDAMGHVFVSNPKLDETKDAMIEISSFVNEEKFWSVVLHSFQLFAGDVLLWFSYGGAVRLD